MDHTKFTDFLQQVGESRQKMEKLISSDSRPDNRSIRGSHVRIYGSGCASMLPEGNHIVCLEKKEAKMDFELL